jgi:hypothetical protein
MARNIVIGALVVVVIGVLLLPLVVRGLSKDSVPMGVTTPLHEFARDGSLGEVERLLADGADPNAGDEAGKTPLHWAAANGHVGTAEALIKGGANPNLRDAAGATPIDLAVAGGHSQTAESLRAASGQFPLESSGGAQVETVPENTGASGLNPSLKYADLPSFEAGIGQPGCLLTSEHVWMFSPKTREDAAEIVFPYLTKAYDVLRGIVGVDTEFIIVVYNFPKGNQEAFGGTSNCVIYYDEENLELEDFPEWTQYHVPHVSGYIEEMAHNFVAATHSQFGWEMVGWSIGVKASQAVASNPVFLESLTGTYQGQADTYQRYVASGFVLPTDVPPNQVDRIHAYILSECERQYGPSFWPDFFGEVRKEALPLRDAVQLDDGDAIRNERYRITVECFERLPGLHFKQILQNSGISLTTDVKSLHPTEAGWNRRLL